MKWRNTAVLLAACLLLTGCAGTAQKETASTAFSVNDEEISLREWNFYVRMNQMQWEKSYLEQYGDDMWSREVDDDGTTLADSLKEDVLDSVVKTHLTNQYAEKYGVALDEEQLEEAKERAQSFMSNYNEALLDYAEADEDFVYEKICETELQDLVMEASVEDYEPELQEEDYHREGICYVLISVTGIRDEAGELTPFTDEEVAERTALVQQLCEDARESGDLKSAAEALDLTPIESSVGKDNEGDGHEPLMLNAARLLEVGEISDPIETEEGWFLVQHTSDYDADGTEYWKEYLTDQAKEERCQELYDEWKAAASITLNQEIMDQVNVKHVLKELL